MPDVDIYAKLREYIARSTKTQRKIAEEAGIPNPSYLSHMVNGRINWVTGEYFRPLTEALGLKKEEIKELRPDLFWDETDVQAASDPPPSLSSALSAKSKYGRIPRQEITIPDTLQQAADEYGHLPMYRGLRRQSVLEFMIGSTSREFTPTTVEGWLTEFTDLKRMGYIKEAAEE